MSGTSTSSPVGKGIHHPATPGILLLLATMAALAVANIPALSPYYDRLLGLVAGVKVGEFKIEKPLLLWINDGLMAIFFLYVGLELKREYLWGALRSIRTVALPFFGAIGGLIVPAVIYLAFNWSDPVARNGWAIPAATDIAFVIGILAVLGSRVPSALKVFVVTLAVIDDLCAILIIALFYTEQVSVGALVWGGGFIAVLLLLNRFGVRSLSPFAVVGLLLWVAVLKSGVHATLAGVITAFLIPALPPRGVESDDPDDTMVSRVEHALEHWVAFAILPLFAFANAGLNLQGMGIEQIFHPVPLGIAAGLFFGKQIGVTLGALFCIVAGFSKLPENLRWGHVYGGALLAGIGFTMSLFIGSLAFEATGEQSFIVDDRIGILIGSILSGVAGGLVLWIVGRDSRRGKAL